MGDVIPLPDHPGQWAHPTAVALWEKAGSPPITDAGAGRLYATQKWLYDSWQAGLPGFYPADNPDEPWRPLAHVRGVAFDFATRAGAAAAQRAGFIFPYPYEWWHGELPNVRQYPIITEAPQEDDMPSPEEYASAVWTHPAAAAKATTGETLPAEPMGTRFRRAHLRAEQMIRLVSAQSAALEALAQAKGIDPSPIVQAVEDAAAGWSVRFDTE